jgi:hypothetical protein
MVASRFIVSVNKELRPIFYDGKTVIVEQKNIVAILQLTEAFVLCLCHSHHIVNELNAHTIA